ncbi:MAG: DNA-binding protein [Cyanobacteria bacterium P01_F01_bin.143]
MVKLNIENLDKEIIRQLEQRAALNGCSVESELDKILKTVFSPKNEKKSLKKLLLEMPDVGEDADFCCRLDSSRQIDL